MATRSAILIALFCIVPAVAQARTITMPLKAGARVQVAPLVDGFTVGLFVRGVDAPTLKRHLEGLRPQSVQILAPKASETVAYLRFADRVTRAQATLAPQGRRGRAALAILLQVDTEDARDAMLAHALKAPLPLPASLDADELKEADHQLISGHVAQAELLLEQLKKSYALHVWVLLRLGDVAARKQDLVQACTYYADASREGLERTASMMALLRARVLGCPSKAEPPWDRLLSRDAIDDPVGQYISDEAAWALDYERDLKALHTVRALEGHFYDRTINRALRQAITARLIRFETPLGVAALAEHSSMLAGHPEAFDLDLAAGRAWCTLGSAASWKQRSSQANTWMRLSHQERQKWQEQASACTLGPLAPIHLTAPKTAPPLPEAHLETLGRRLAAASREAAHLYAPKKPAPQMPTAQADEPGATQAPPDDPAKQDKEKP